MVIKNGHYGHCSGHREQFPVTAFLLYCFPQVFADFPADFRRFSRRQARIFPQIDADF
jgi:hypothetical protein